MRTANSTSKLTLFAFCVGNPKLHAMLTHVMAIGTTSEEVVAGIREACANPDAACDGIVTHDPSPRKANKANRFNKVQREERLEQRNAKTVDDLYCSRPAKRSKIANADAVPGREHNAEPSTPAKNTPVLDSTLPAIPDAKRYLGKKESLTD